MSSNYLTGVKSEDRSERFIKNMNFQILERRYKTKFGEIDIIAKKNDLIIFVEVKHRKNIINAHYAISELQKKRIYDSANIFITSLKDNFEKFMYRFDVILTDGKEIVYYENVIN